MTHLMVFGFVCYTHGVAIRSTNALYAKQTVALHGEQHLSGGCQGPRDVCLRTAIPFVAIPTTATATVSAILWGNANT